jgi:pimeloyl-ACP methyl ester carboxylesterase
MAAAGPHQVDGVAYREAVPEQPSGRAPALCLHGFPETSYMWGHVLERLAAAGRRALAPDFPGFGDSPPDPPGTWERQVEVVERFRRAVGLDRVALIVHDWGGLIGLRWACEHPDAVAALVISNTGFFPDGRWHGMARALRTEGEGERLVESLDREGFAQMLGAVSPRYDRTAAYEYWKTFETEAGRSGILELYRSGDFEKLAVYDGQLGRLGVPTLLLWGKNDVFAPLAGANRFQREIAGSKLVVIEEAGHFVYADEPRRCADEIAAFLAESGV